MANNSIATISPKVTRGEELIVIPRSLYEKFLGLREEYEHALAKVKRGRKALREGKTYIASSPRNLLGK